MSTVYGQNWQSEAWRRDDGTEVAVAELGLEEIKEIYRTISGYPDNLDEVLPSPLWEALNRRAAEVG